MFEIVYIEAETEGPKLFKVSASVVAVPLLILTNPRGGNSHEREMELLQEARIAQALAGGNGAIGGGPNKPVAADALDEPPTDRGRRSETRVLKEMGLDKNTDAFQAIDYKTGFEGTTIPDAVRLNGQTVEFKGVQELTDSPQLRMQSAVSARHGVKAQVVTRPLHRGFGHGSSKNGGHSETGPWSATLDNTGYGAKTTFEDGDLLPAGTGAPNSRRAACLALGIRQRDLPT